jgi:hypothetical protein
MLDLKIHHFTAVRDGQILGHFSNAAAAIQSIQYEGRGFHVDATEVFDRSTRRSIHPKDFLSTLREADLKTRKFLQGRFLTNL